MEPDAIAALKALTDPTRLRIVGRLAAGPASNGDLVGELDLPLAVVVRQVGVLRQCGLLGPASRPGAERYSLRIDTLHALGRALDERERTAFEPSVPVEDVKTLRGYVADGRLTTIPAQERKRLVVLRWLLDEVFTEDRDYPEKEVNQRLALFHPDVAALRRYLVDARLVSRDRGLYRRVDAERPSERPPEPAADRPGV